MMSDDQLQLQLQNILRELLRDDNNKYCEDCCSIGPRWASWTLGIFLCMRCAGIHRKMGVHLSRVKSVDLDYWTNNQVAMMVNIGNTRGRAIYEAKLEKNFSRPQTDSLLEQFIRSKYEHKRYIDKEWIHQTPTIDVIAEERKQNKIKKRVNNSGRNSLISFSRRDKIETPVNIKSEEIDDKYKPVLNNRADLHRLESDKAENNFDDDFGDFICYAQPNISTDPSLTDSTIEPVTVSSIVEDMIEHNLGNSSSVSNMPDTNIAPSMSTYPALPNVENNSIVILENNSTINGTSQMPTSLAWPNAGAPGYENNLMQSYFQTQGYVINRNNWMVPGQMNRNSAFVVQHNPFFNNSMFPGQPVIPIFQEIIIIPENGQELSTPYPESNADSFQEMSTQVFDLCYQQI